MSLFFRVRWEADRFQNVVPVDDDDWDRISELDGGAARFSTLRLQILKDRRGDLKLKPSDAPNLAAHVLVFSERAKTILENHTAACGVWIRLSCEPNDYWLLNVTDVRDALDYERSRCSYFKSSGRLMDVENHVLRADRLNGTFFFKVKGLEKMDVFASESAYKRYEEANLTGLVFEPVGSV